VWAPSFRNRKTNDCEHLSTRSTSSYGLQRIVCNECGNVRMEYLYDFVEDLASKGRGHSERIIAPEPEVVDQPV